MSLTTDVEYFARLVEALDPWLDQVVIIGGWAHRLYRLHPLAQPLDYEPLATIDADICLPLNLPTTGEQLRARLLERDFHEELRGDTQPPTAHYRAAAGDSSFYAEFLTVLEGSEVKRRGRRDVTARISGVPVQKLRHLELMLKVPWNVMIGPASGYPTPRVRRVLVPNPAAFLVQKILTHNKRNQAKRARDVLYIHDTIETFGGSLAAIRQQWETNVRPALHANAARRVERAAEKYFRIVDDSIREASRMATTRNLTPEMVLEVCRYGWQQIFA